MTTLVDLRCANSLCESRGAEGKFRPRLLARISSTGSGVVQVRCPQCGSDTLTVHESPELD